MSGCTIYAFIFLLYFSRYTTSLQTPGNTMKTLKCKYGAIKALLNVGLCTRLRRGMLGPYLPRAAASPLGVPEARNISGS